MKLLNSKFFQNRPIETNTTPHQTPIATNYIDSPPAQKPQIPHNATQTPSRNFFLNFPMYNVQLIERFDRESIRRINSPVLIATIETMPAISPSQNRRRSPKTFKANTLRGGVVFEVFYKVRCFTSWRAHVESYAVIFQVTCFYH